jgi:hypothetical protein
MANGVGFQPNQAQPTGSAVQQLDPQRQQILQLVMQDPLLQQAVLEVFTAAAQSAPPQQQAPGQGAQQALFGA